MNCIINSRIFNLIKKTAEPHSCYNFGPQQVQVPPRSSGKSRRRYREKLSRKRPLRGGCCLILSSGSHNFHAPYARSPRVASYPPAHPPRDARRSRRSVPSNFSVMRFLGERRGITARLFARVARARARRRAVPYIKLSAGGCCRRI